jgi:hypothetical protein
VAAEPRTLTPDAADSPVEAQAPRLLCLFHFNLAFSSLEEEAHAQIIRRCYWPALRLAEETGFPIALEATGWTLRRIAALDPDFITRLRALLAVDCVELVGSAYAQCAAPLLPAEVNAWNLRLGREVYKDLLDVAPRIALVCEQVYSPGLVPLYLQAGYEALIVDWDNARRSHPEWPEEYRLHPQRAYGGGCSIPVVWSTSIVFQKFQRYAHGELSLDRYLAYVRGALGVAGVSTQAGRALMLYANDVEIFDHRPGRFAAEPDLQADEWGRITTALRALREQRIGAPTLPLALLRLLDVPGAGHELALESPSQPIPVKKQDKYNIVRWAVSGRDDIGINTRCWRLYERLRREGCEDPTRWRELCELYASDFRTHITEARWNAYCERLAATERAWLSSTRDKRAGVVSSAERAVLPAGAELHGEETLTLSAGALTARLNLRRGLAIEALTDARVCSQPLLGTLEHGYFPTIDLGADFYSGHLVQESPLTHKITDLAFVQPAVSRDNSGRLCAHARIATELGPIEKTLKLDNRGLELEWILRWRELPPGSLRLGYVTLLPAAFQADALFVATHNGGSGLDTYAIGGAGFDHGAAVSALVSCRQGFGLTEGLVLIGDARRAISVRVAQSCACPLGLLAWTPGVPGSERWFLRLCFALAESDDTRRAGIPRDPSHPQVMRLHIAARDTSTCGVALTPREGGGGN